MTPDVSALSARDILAIPEDQPERLFGTPDAVTALWHALAQRWHPDHTTDTAAASVFSHLALLRDKARERRDLGLWRIPGLLELRGTDGTLRRARYVRDFPFELGTAYLGGSLLTFVIEDEYADLAETARRTIAGLGYANDGMRDSLAGRLPVLKTGFKTRDQTVLILERPAETLRLRDVLDHFGGRIDPVHVAWIVSELLNLACYLAWAGVAHDDISLDSVYIVPAQHKVWLPGGWWYANPIGGRMNALPERTLTVAPATVLDTKQASPRVALELIRLLGRELLGDPDGLRLGADPTVPKALGAWLRLPAPDSPREDYGQWPRVLRDSFGPPRFVALDLTADTLYKKGA